MARRFGRNMVGKERGGLVQAGVPGIVEVVAVVVRGAVIVAVEGRVAVHEPRAGIAAERRVVARLGHRSENAAAIAPVLIGKGAIVCSGARVGPRVCVGDRAVIGADTALHDAARQGFNSVIQLLADRGADVNVKNKRDETPLKIAARVQAADSGLRPLGHEDLRSTADLLRKLGAEE